MLNKPQFLRTPPLYEEGTAMISWENTADAEMYELDIVFNETFDENESPPAQGLMWRNIEFFGRTWAQWDADLQAAWKWMEEHAPVFTVYKGPGEDVPSPDQGLDWNTIEVADWNWGDQDGPDGLTWKEISLLLSVGLNWSQHDGNRLTWNEFEAKYDNWIEFETQPARGLTWESLDARRLNWNGFESLGDSSTGLTWEQLEHLQPDNQTHKGCEVAIPLYAKWSMLRVRAVSDNDCSEYLVTGILRHLPRSLAKYKPPCLHVPELREGETTDIAWGELYGASGYVLERRLGAGGGWSAVHDGMGTALTREEWQAARGDPALAYQSWLDTLNNDASRKDFGTPTDDQPHYLFTDTLPYLEKNMQYRLKGYNATDGSLYLESAFVSVIPVFYREATLKWQAKAGTSYWVSIEGCNLRSPEQVPLTFRYDAGVLTHTDFMTQIPGKQPGPGVYPSAYLQIDACALGEVQFRCIRPIHEESRWSGCVTCIELIAHRDGTAEVSLF